MIEKTVNKILVLIAMILVGFIYLPKGLGFKIYSLQKENQTMQALVYIKPISFEQINIEDELLVYDRMQKLYLSQVKNIDYLQESIRLMNDEVITSKALLGKKIIALPFLGEGYAFFNRMDYNLKLLILTILLGLDIAPEVVKKIYKNRRFHSHKMIQ